MRAALIGAALATHLRRPQISANSPAIAARLTAFDPRSPHREDVREESTSSIAGFAGRANSRFHVAPDPQHRPNSRLEASYHRADKAIEKVVQLIATAWRLTRQSRSRLV
jgi:hypothetical protein